jgi:hypothetical protein
VRQDALRKGLFPGFAIATTRHPLFEAGTIMLVAEIGQRRGDFVSRVALGAGTERSADLSLHVHGKLEQIDGYEWRRDGAGRYPFRRDFATQFPPERFEHGLRRREFLGDSGAEISLPLPAAVAAPPAGSAAL